MNRYRKVKSDIIQYINLQKPNVVMQGCNTQSVMGAGLAKALRIKYNVNEFDEELNPVYNLYPNKTINKLGNIDYGLYNHSSRRIEVKSVLNSISDSAAVDELLHCNAFNLARHTYRHSDKESPLESTILTNKTIFVNAYTQHKFADKYSSPDKIFLDYDALQLCLRKVNNLFEGMTVVLPKIGCGLARGDWSIVEPMIEKTLKDCFVTIVDKKL